MEPVEYMSPDGRVEEVTSPPLAVRLRARGWWPVAELREQASVPGPAADWLKRAEAAAEERRRRESERAEPPTASEPPAGRPRLEDQQPQPAVQKTAAKKPAK